MIRDQTANSFCGPKIPTSSVRLYSRRLPHRQTVHRAPRLFVPLTVVLTVLALALRLSIELLPLYRARQSVGLRLQRNRAPAALARDVTAYPKSRHIPARFRSASYARC